LISELTTGEKTATVGITGEGATPGVGAVAAGVAAFATGVGVAAVTGVAADAGSPEPEGDWNQL